VKLATVLDRFAVERQDDVAHAEPGACPWTTGYHIAQNRALIAFEPQPGRQGRCKTVV
jgi:hypothetical protein